MTYYKFLKIVLLTIISYRVGTYIVIYFWGYTAWWHGVYTDPWNHYQIGSILVLIGLVAYKAKRLKKINLILIAIGTGMIIDEVTDVIKLFHLYSLPSNFRDSFPDLILIAITYLVFSGIILSVNYLLKISKRN
jgi:hypothetical protein